MNDRVAVYLVIFFLGGIAAGCITAATVLKARGIDPGEMYNTIASACVGGLTAFFVSIRTTPQEPIPVSGPAGPGDPVDTREVDP